jgi:hypothetical protein
MSWLTYTTCSHQRKFSLAGVVHAAELVAHELECNAVLQNCEVSAAQSNDRSLIGIHATVEANPADELSVLMALNAADEQWCYALGAVGCDSCTGPSQLRVQGRAC